MVPPHASHLAEAGGSLQASWVPRQSSTGAAGTDSSLGLPSSPSQPQPSLPPAPQRPTAAVREAFVSPLPVPENSSPCQQHPLRYVPSRGHLWADLAPPHPPQGRLSPSTPPRARQVSAPQFPPQEHPGERRREKTGWGFEDFQGYLGNSLDHPEAAIQQHSPSGTKGRKTVYKL